MRSAASGMARVWARSPMAASAARSAKRLDDRSEKSRPGQRRLREHDGGARGLRHAGIDGLLISLAPGSGM